MLASNSSQSYLKSSLSCTTAQLTIHTSFDVELPTILNLVPCLSKHEYQSPANTSQSAFDYTFESSFFDWMKENPAILRSYDLYMAGRRVGKPSWLNFYPIEERLLQGTGLESGVFMVDIGGGQGHELKSLSEKYRDKGLPGRLILQDMVAIDREVCDSTFEYMVHNFFEPQPVKGISPAAKAGLPE